MTTSRIAEHTIPLTESTVKIEIQELVRDGKVRTTYIVTREAGQGFNYLSCGRKTEAEARKEANFLWTDGRDRAAREARRAYRQVFGQV